MVQIIEENRKPTFLEKVGVHARDYASLFKEMGEERKLAKEHPDIAKLPEQFREMAYQSKLRQQEQSEKLRGEREFEGEDYQKIEEVFGKNFADIWKAAPTGGKTELLKMGIESKLRGQDIGDMFEDTGIGTIQGEKQQPEVPVKGKKEIDFDKGLTPKERTRRQEDRYAKNLPLYQELEKKRVGLESEKDALTVLEDLSPQIGAIERLNINPQTGELILPALASKEAQRFVKTINDFTTKAKDTYGARVTNFELDRFLKRLPTLANSEEGRTEIIKQMQIINDINKKKEDNLNRIFDEYGGIRNIDFDQAERLADKRSKPEVDNLRKEFSKIDANLDKQQKKTIDDRKKNTPKGKVSVEKADGTQGYIDSEKVANFLKIPGNKLL